MPTQKGKWAVTLPSEHVPVSVQGAGGGLGGGDGLNSCDNPENAMASEETVDPVSG